MRSLVCVAIFIFFTAKTSAQNFDASLTKYSNLYTGERLYLHYDKSTYVPGETVWFKVYLMKTFLPADESKTVYIDWLDDQGNILYHTAAPVVDATSFGQFQIPANYLGSFIHVRAYTSWMRNFDPDFLYNKNITILSYKKDSSVLDKIIPELTFFPEGGEIVEAVNNKIAFKANDQYGRPIRITGIVKSSNGSVIDSLRDIHDGMGYFFIIPTDGESFSGYWKDENGVDHVTQLPAVKSSGVALKVTISPGRRNFLVSSYLLPVKKVHIIGTMYQQQIFKFDQELQDGKVEGSIPTGSLPTGILTITVFDDQWNPLAERITYINNREYFFQPEINISELSLNKRSKNKVVISVPGNISSDLSVSITDANLDYDSSDNIIPHLLLTGELKGRVNDPSHYFINNTDSITQQLDLVMLTHGWRRFDWIKIKNGEFPVLHYNRDTSYLYLAGKVFGASPTQLKKAGDIILMVRQDTSGTQTFIMPVQPNGSFGDPSLILFDSVRVFYNFVNSKGLKNISVRFMTDVLPPYSPGILPKQIFLNPDSEQFSNQYQLKINEEVEQGDLDYLKAKVLKTVKIKARVKSPTQEINDKYTSGMFKGGNATELNLINDPLAVTYTDIVSYIQGKVPGLSFDVVAHKFVWMRNRSGENGPTLYLNEMMTSYDMISQIPVANVAYIKVFKPGFVGGVGSGTGGAIVVYTRMGADGQNETEKGLNNNFVTGYSVIREFYSPNYENNSDIKKDLRTTLYWNPSILTSPDKNNVDFTFYNNDITKGFRIVIEGMTKDGRLAHIEKIIK